MRIQVLWVSILFLLSCNFDKDPKLKTLFFNQSRNLSSAKELKSFQFLGISPPVTASITGNFITANLPSSVDSKSLVPTLEFTGANIIANGVVQENGKSSNDFSKPITYSIQAEDGSKLDFTVRIDNSSFSVLGSNGNVNITGLSSTDTGLEMYYDSSENTLKPFGNNTKIGIVLSNGTNYALRFKSQPTGKICALSGGSLSGTLNSDISFSINCISGFLIGGRVVSKISTFTIPANGAIVTTVAGSLPPVSAGWYVDGIGGASRMNYPLGVTSDGTNLYIADTSNHCIRVYTISTGAVSTLAGNCGTSGSSDGVGNFAQFNEPMQISTDGTNLYVCDRGSNTIRKVLISTREVSTIIGLAGSAGDTIGIGSSARLNFPNGITTDGNHLYISDRGNHKIKKAVISSNVVTLLAGTGVGATIDNTIGSNAGLNTPCDSVVVNSILYFVECSASNRLRSIDLTVSTNPVSTIAGSGVGASVDGVGLTAQFNDPHGIETDGTNLFITEWLGRRIRRVNISSLTVFTIAGFDGYQDGTGMGVGLGNLGGITSDGNRLYFVDASNHSLRRIDNAPD